MSTPSVFCQPDKYDFDFSVFFDGTQQSVAIPPSEDFERDLDSHFASLDDTHFNGFNTSFVLPTEPFALRSQTPGPPSAITTSSDFDTTSITSYSQYQYPSPAYTGSHYSGLDMEFSAVRVSSSDYGMLDSMGTFGARGYPGVGAQGYNSTTFGTLPPSPPNSPPARALPRARSDYSPVSSIGQHIRFSGQSTVSPHHLSPQLPTVPSVLPVASVPESDDGSSSDSRRKHQCPSCFRAFARAYNLKTHMDTHNPDRPKPHMCPHPSCGRQFSRKHDLQRHRAAIHRDQSSGTSVSPVARAAALPPSKRQAIGEDFPRCRDVK
ncbi:hypothetical protein EWM64_g696 [Hericium alpestre]|uniref:C2H2-type domain-containing protein n=1 Tax=Hericium alpestre TaxID=135208 RepID=A0A4Z0ACC9_9AGAM|nr:hypothetical protein EWM64_g696 [Hericium alpestre]